MFALWSHWLVFLVFSLAKVQVEARPTRPTTFISLPLQKFYLRDTLDNHPAIVSIKRYLTNVSTDVVYHID